MTTFLEYICSNQGMVEKHMFTDCCTTNNTERLECFLSYKKDDMDYREIFQIPKPEQICEMDKENQMSMKAW
jgi:hypothetical protein